MLEGQGSVQSSGGDKGLGAQTAGARATSQSYLMGCLVAGATTTKLLPLSFVSSVGLKPAGKKGGALVVPAGAWTARSCRKLSLSYLCPLGVFDKNSSNCQCKAMGPVPGHSDVLVMYS